MTGQPATPAASAAWSVRYTLAGLACELTLTGQNFQELMTQATQAITYLRHNGAQPAQADTILTLNISQEVTR